MRTAVCATPKKCGCGRREGRSVLGGCQGVRRDGDCGTAASEHLQAVRQSSDGKWNAAGHDVDGHGIPVVAADEVGRILEDGPEFDLTEALHAAAAGITSSGGREPVGKLCLLGFLLLDQHSARLYVTGEGPADAVGLDVSLRDEEGAVAVPGPESGYGPGVGRE